MEKNRGLRISRNRAFTIPELLITVLIGMGLMAGIGVLFIKISEGLSFSSGLHTQIQKTDRFREEYSEYAKSYPFFLWQSNSGVIDLSEFGFEAGAFSNAWGDAGFIIGAAASNGTGFLVASQYPYEKYYPVIVPINASEIATIRSSGIDSILSSLPVSRGKIYRDTPVSRLIITESETALGKARIDLSFLATYEDALVGNSFAQVKNDPKYESYPLTIQDSSPANWDRNSCFATTKTVNGRTYSVPSVINLGFTAAEASASITNGSVIYRQSFVCQNGTVSADGPEVAARTTCDSGYVWNGTSCGVPSSPTSQIANCTGLPTNALWNSVASISQNWDGSAWIPSYTGSYSLAASTSECRFICKPGFVWNGTLCGMNCPVPAYATHNGRTYVIGTLGTIGNGASVTRNGFSYFGTPPEDGNLQASFEFACNGNTVTTTSSSTGTASCNPNYTFGWSWASPNCFANTRTFTCAAKPASGTLWNTVSSYIQTWNGSAWLPEDSTTAYDTSASTTSCKYTCSSGFGWESGFCGTTVNGSCGTSNGWIFNSPPSSNLCSQGTASAVAPNASGTWWVWTCSWVHEGALASCWATSFCNPIAPQIIFWNRSANGYGMGFGVWTSIGATCNGDGSYNFTVRTSCMPDDWGSCNGTTDALNCGCGAGTYCTWGPAGGFSQNNSGRTDTWSIGSTGWVGCVNAWVYNASATANGNGTITINTWWGNSMTVSPYLAQNGVCGSSHGTFRQSAPSSNLCSVGTPSAITGTWDWNCLGENLGTNAACHASLAGSYISQYGTGCGCWYCNTANPATGWCSCPAGTTATETSSYYGWDICWGGCGYWYHTYTCQ